MHGEGRGEGKKDLGNNYTLAQGKAGILKVFIILFTSIPITPKDIY